MKIKNIIFKGFAIGAAVLTVSCGNDYLDADPSEFLSEEGVKETMEADPTLVQAYVTGAYYNIYCGGDYWTTHDDFGMPSIFLATDLMCEDMAYPRDANWFCYDYQMDNRASNYRRTGSMWNQLYNVIDNANTIITMLKPEGGGVPDNKQNKVMLGEAYAMRAYCYFWLVNLYQQPLSTGADLPGVPLKTETEYRPERVPIGEIYTQIKSDIDNGYTLLKGEGLSSKGAISEYSAAGIYADVLMFTGDYAKAAEYAEIASTGTPLNSEAEMLSGFNSVNMSEVLWGYSVNVETTGFYASFFSNLGSYQVGYGGKSGYRKMIASNLYDKIAANDVRKKWFGLNEEYAEIGGVDFSYEEQLGYTDYIQTKFVDVSTMGTGGTLESDIIFMRSGTMCFVAAEAYYLANKPTEAKRMLEKVMSTRIPGYTCSKSGDALLEEICLQKRIDTWGEGVRYLDAKRRNDFIDRSLSTNQAADLAAMNAVSYSARDYRMIYQIPLKEIQNNDAISESDQNP
ncbi:MAG: RagB/SusD family nutrient uptake outer membrane protein [Pseudoflavonifractor sp.]|nr:RagB/SusD family nutrient uptake outer membrane protein [Pseudoflavonifractor sp.]